MATDLTKTETPWKPVSFEKSGFEIVPDDVQLEEERCPTFQDGDYYPVEIGDVLVGRYQVLGKLGYGISSTVWLASDLMDCQFFSLKIFNRNATCQKELQFYEEHKRVNSDHPGRARVRNLVRTIELPRGEETHTCLVFAPLSLTVMNLMLWNPDQRIPEPIVKGIVAQTLLALEHLHQDCRVIHTDIKPESILFPFDDPDDAIAEFCQSEKNQPSPRKIVDGKTIYKSRRFRDPKSFPLPLLCDFGSYEHGDSKRSHHAQSDLFRAPEVMLQANWSYPIDIWNVATMTWLLLEGEPLFHGYGLLTGKEDDEVMYLTQCHLAEIISVLGPPPLDLIKRGKKSSEYFNKDGSCKIEKWRMPPRETLEEREVVLTGERKELFLDFIRCALAWRPEDRKTAGELLAHPWFGATLLKKSPLRMMMSA